MLGMKFEQASFDKANLQDAEIEISTIDKATSFRGALLLSSLIRFSNDLNRDTLISIFSQSLVNNTLFADPVTGRKIRDQAWLNHWLDDIKRLKRKNSWNYYRKSIVAGLWWLFSDYGRSMKRWVFASVFFICAFWIIYHPVPSFFPDWWRSLANEIGPKFDVSPPGRVSNCFSWLYLSIVTFTTLGYGDIIPSNLSAEILLSVEVVIGYVMMGGLLSILATFLCRRND